MRILFIYNLFQPEPNFVRGIRFVRAIQNRGHEVRVLTGFPNYPGGKVYPGYRICWTQEERLEGVPITRVAMYPSHDRSALGRSFNFLTLGASMLAHVPWLRERFDACYVDFGPITLAWPAIFLKWARGTRIVADVQDIWPESVADSGMMQAALPMAIIRRLTQWTYKKSDRLVVLSEGYRDSLVQRGIAPERVKVIYNWTHEETLGARANGLDRYIDRANFNVVYAGNIGPLQGLSHVVDAAKLLAATPSRCRIVLVGSGVEYDLLRRRIDDERLPNISLHPRVDAAVARGIQSAADVLLLHLVRTPLTRIGIPQKLQSYMASGKPVLAAAEGDAARIVAEARCGVTCPPSDPRALADRILQLEHMAGPRLGEMSENGRRYYSSAMAFDVGVEKFLHVLSELT